MPIDREKMFKEFQKLLENAKVPECPPIFMDERLEDAFLEPIADENGYCASIPALCKDYEYGKFDNGVLFITKRSAFIKSSLYSKYLNEESLVWDSINSRLLLYIPDAEEPRLAFKGSAWQFAKKLKPEFEEFITLRDIYFEYLAL